MILGKLNLSHHYYFLRDDCYSSLCTEAKVGDLDLPVLPEEDVVRLDVPVQDAPLVQVADPLQGDRYLYDIHT